MITILKYPLEIDDQQVIGIHGRNDSAPPQILKVGLDLNGKPCVWAIGDPECEPQPYTFFIIMTGKPAHMLKPHYAYMGTLEYMEHLWHVFMVKGDDGLTAAAKKVKGVATPLDPKGDGSYDGPDEFPSHMGPFSDIGVK